MITVLFSEGFFSCRMKKKKYKEALFFKCSKGRLVDFKYVLIFFQVYIMQGNTGEAKELKMTAHFLRIYVHFNKNKTCNNFPKSLKSHHTCIKNEFIARLNSSWRLYKMLNTYFYVI